MNNEAQHFEADADTSAGRDAELDFSDTWFWNVLPPCIPMSGFAFDSVREEMEALERR